MRLTLPPLEIGRKDGFDKTDIFNAKPFGERLADIVEQVEEPLVIAIDGPWGSGKSVFAKQWAGLLRQRKTPVIEFDAFANDYQDDAFIALAGEIVAHAKEELGTATGKGVLSDFIGKAAKVGRVLAPTAAKAALKAVTFGAVSADDVGKDVEQALEAAATDAGTLLENALRDRLANAESATSMMRGFGAELARLAEALARNAKPDAEDVGPRLVIVIDELDRCKPSFALDLLEKIKHFYSVPGVVFVFITHLPQIEAAVRGRYGVETDAGTYLGKFIGLRFGWAPFDKSKQPAAKVYVRVCLERMGVAIFDEYVDLIEFACGRGVLSLRSVEKICAFMAINSRHFVVGKRDAIDILGNIVIVLFISKELGVDVGSIKSYGAFNDKASRAMGWETPPSRSDDWEGYNYYEWLTLLTNDAPTERQSQIIARYLYRFHDGVGGVLRYCIGILNGVATR